jgi:hypothetical protein
MQTSATDRIQTRGSIIRPDLDHCASTAASNNQQSAARDVSSHIVVQCVQPRSPLYEMTDECFQECQQQSSFSPL